MSNYLARLPEGENVDLRGPHLGVDLTGEIKEVIFLAGGTGIAPAMQVIYTLLARRREENKGLKIRIVWANRKKEDSVRGGRQDHDTGTGGSVVAELNALQRRFSDLLKVEYLVDEEGLFIDEKKIFALTRSDSLIKHGATSMGIDSKLLFVSGPEGFVEFLSGPKKWEDGKESQGEVSGIVGRLGLKDWKVWKL